MTGEDAEPVALRTIAWAYFRITMSSFGGGLSGWAHKILVREMNWLDEPSFLSALALARIMPGANQVNLAVIVGTQLRGPLGALAAVLGLTIGPLILILALGYGYFHGHELPEVADTLAAMAAAAAGLAFSVGYDTAKPYWKRPIPLLLALAAFLAIGIMHWPMLYVIGGLAPFGILWAWFSDSAPTVGK